MDNNRSQEKKWPKSLFRLKRISPWPSPADAVGLGRNWTLFFLLLTFFPVSALAQAEDVFELSETIYDILISVGKLFWLLAIMLFIWGVVKFMRNANDTTEHEAGKTFILWGIISFVVLVSLWAIVELVLSDTLNVDTVGELPYIIDIDKSDE